MNTKFSFVLLMIVIAMIAAACAPKVTDASAPLDPAAPPAVQESPALVPVTGESASPAALEPQESRKWSGEIFLSDTNSPDHLPAPQPAMDAAPEEACMSGDEQPRPQSGCIE